MQGSLTAGTLHPYRRNGAIHQPEAHLVLPVPHLYLFARIDRLQVRPRVWADLLTSYPSDQTRNRLGHVPTVNLTMALLMVAMRGVHLMTMDDLIVLSIPATARILVVEPRREALVLWSVATMAEEIRGSTRIGLCVHLPETPGDPYSPLHGGSLRRTGTPEMQGTPGTIASGLTTGDIPCRQVRSPDEHLQTRASHRNTMHTNATHHHLDIRRLTGKMLHRLGPLPTCQHPRMVPLSIPLELL